MRKIKKADKGSEYRIRQYSIFMGITRMSEKDQEYDIYELCEEHRWSLVSLGTALSSIEVVIR